MIRKCSVVLCVLSMSMLFLLTCTTGQSPFKPQDASVSLILQNSSGHRDTASVTDTVGNQVLIAMIGYLPSYINSVKVLICTSADTDTVLTYPKATLWADTQRINIKFHSMGTRTVTVDASLQRSDKIVTATIVIVERPVWISTQPTSISVDPNGSALFFVTPKDTGTFRYQWIKDGTPISGATKDTLIIDPVLAANAGVYTCLVKDQWGDSILTNEAVLTINQGSTSNHKPVLSVTGVRNILTAQACSLSLSATDPDAGQTLTYAMIKSPQGATLTANIFRWTAPAGQTGADTAIFTVTDNGTPPMSDTQTVIITVSSQITVPVKVPGVKAVSKANGYFVFSWNKVSNADSYNIFRSADTVAADFQKIGSTSDSLFDDSAKMTNYYYYVVAVNTAGSSPASALVYSGSIKTPPVIMVLADTAVAQGKTLSFMVQTIAPAQDTVTLAATDTTGVKLPDSATFNAKTGIFTWTPTFGQLGLYKIVFTAGDGNAVAKDTVKITVTKTDRPPVVQPQSVNAGRNQAITITLAATDPDGDAITQWQVTQKPDNGTATLADSTKGSVVYTPNTGFIGTDTFAVRASDGTLWSVASANVIVTVDSSKVAPKIQVQPRPDTTVNQGGSVTFTVGINSGAFPTPTFTWYKGTKGSGASLQAGTSPTYQKTGVVAADSGNYYVVVSNASGADTSAYAHLAVNAPASAPMLASPANGATGLPVSLTLVWNKVPGALAYYVQVASDTGFTIMLVSDSTQTDTTKAISGFSKGSTYYWRVMARNAVGTGAWSAKTSFTTIKQFALMVTATSGAVTKTPNATQYDSGTVVGLKALPNAGYQFGNWTGDATSSTDSATVVMNGTKNVTANFSVIQYQLTVTAGTGGTVTAPATSPATVNSGAQTTITASPSVGYKFVNWTKTSGSCTIADSTQATTTVKDTSGNATVQANFAALACSWNQVLSNNSSTQDIFSIAACGNTIMAGQQQLGIQRSTDNGTTWSYLFEGGPYVNAIYRFGTHTLAGSSGSSPGIYVSPDSGATWTQPLVGTKVYSFASAGDTLYAGTNGAGVVSSADNGTTWNSDPSNDLEATSIYAVAVSGATLYAGTDNGLYYRSSPNWYAVTAIPSISVYTLVTNGEALFAGTSSGLYRLNNTTGIWAVVDTGLTNTTINSLVASGNYLFAATGGGVFITTNNGNNWSPVNGGLPGGSVAAGPLAVNSTSIFMGSGYSVYRSPLP